MVVPRGPCSLDISAISHGEPWGEAAAKLTANLREHRASPGAVGFPENSVRFPARRPRWGAGAAGSTARPAHQKGAQGSVLTCS